MLTFAYFFEHWRGIAVEFRMIDQAESSGSNVYGFFRICLISHATDTKKTQQDVDCAQSNEFIHQIYRAILEGKLRKKHVVDQHVLKPGFPLRNHFSQMIACCNILLVFRFTFAEIPQRLFSVGADAVTSFIHDFQHSIGNLQTEAQMVVIHCDFFRCRQRFFAREQGIYALVIACCQSLT